MNEKCLIPHYETRIINKIFWGLLETEKKLESYEHQFGSVRVILKQNSDGSHVFIQDKICEKCGMLFSEFRKEIKE